MIFKQKIYFDEHLALVLFDAITKSPGSWFLGVEKSVYGICETNGVFEVKALESNHLENLEIGQN